MLKIYNTLSGKKENFKAKNSKVEIFVCGPTVYDFPHLGHARTYVFFDAFVKYLRTKEPDVFYLQNITDIDDKIILRAKEKGIAPKELALMFEKEYIKDVKSLNITAVTEYARATEHIKEIISQVERLLKKGYAYYLKDGVYYDISKFKDYGKLARRTAKQAERAVSRIDESIGKKNKGDFCLWKFSEPHEPKWKSPFGYGRPGWHIEDTAITEKFFGSQYDIHGGAKDLIFPHHEAEVAQMEAISGKKPLVRYWMHTGFLTINGRKMSKSLGNFITIREFLKNHSPQFIRFLILSTLWRSPLDYSEKKVIQVKNSLEKIEGFLRRTAEIIESFDIREKRERRGKPEGFEKIFGKAKKDFFSRLDDDFNTPKALAAAFDFMQKMNKFMDKGLINENEAWAIYNFFERMNRFLEIIDFKNLTKPAVSPEIQELVAKREELRKAKKWQEADEIRKEIEKKGYAVEDTATGPRLKK